MKKQKFVPYFFDYKYERRTYKYIGKNYGDSVFANKGWIRNSTRWYRKRVFNRNDSKYKICNTYEEWKKYLLEKKFYNKCDLENMVNYLIGRKRIAEIIFDISKTSVIPLYVATFSATMSLTNEQSSVEIFLLMIFIIAFSAYFIVRYKKEVDFYKDYIGILESNNFSEKILK